jgi:pantoate--beta-alanine ligase
VATVVTKLLNLARPDAAFFGQKDAQQLAVVRRLARDLDLGVAIEAVPTVREPDGLALSSRNAAWTPPPCAGRALHEGLAAAERAVAAGTREAAHIRATALDALRARDVEPEYLELVDPDSFAPVSAMDGRALLALAARVGGTRLIDNVLLSRPSTVITP